MSDDSAQTLISQADAVAATLVELRRQNEPVLLYGSKEEPGIEAMLAEINREPGHLIWQPAATGQAPAVVVGDMLHFEAPRRAGHLVSSAMRCDRIVADVQTGRFELHTLIPGQLTLRHARRDWRARVVAGEMTVAVRLTHPGAAPLTGVLVDLSVGGCRFELVDGDVLPRPDEMVNLRLLFPSGDEPVFGARVGDVAAPNGAPAQIGLIFAGLSDEQARQLWFLTCEIDREAERRRRGRGEMQPLAPSALFEPTNKGGGIKAKSD